MPRITDDALRQVQDALRQYEAEIQATNLTFTTKHHYTLHAINFVRWLDHDFEPGINVR